MSFACVLHFIMSSCAFHFAYVFVSCIRAFSPLTVLQSGAPMSSGVPLFSLAIDEVLRYVMLAKSLSEIRHSYALRRSLLASRRVWVLNFLGMARGLPSGLGISPVDRLSSFVPFGGHLTLQPFNI